MLRCRDCSASGAKRERAKVMDRVRAKTNSDAPAASVVGAKTIMAEKLGVPCPLLLKAKAALGPFLGQPRAVQGPLQNRPGPFRSRS